MGAGRFVGRVGGLAVALGVGAAVSFGTAVAAADDVGATAGPESSNSAQDSPSSSSDSHPGPGGTPADADPSDDEPTPTPEQDTDSDDDGHPDEQVAEPEDDEPKDRPTSKRRASTGQRSTTLQMKSPSTDATPVERTDVAPAAEPATSAPSTPVAVAAAPATEPEPQAPEVAESVNTVPGAVAEAVASDGVPVDPGAAAPALWVLAAAGRRELDGEDGAGPAALAATATDSESGATVIGTPITVGDEPQGIAVSPDGSRAYVPNFNDGTVSVIDLVNGRTIGTIAVGSYPSAVAVSPNRPRAYVTNYVDGTVLVIDTATNKTVGTPIRVGTGPIGIALNPNGSRIYVTNFTGTVSVIDGATNKVVGSPIRVGSYPRGVAVSPDGSRVFVANFNGASVSVIDTAANQTVGAAIAVGNYPQGVAVSPDGSRVYVTSNSGTVSVINTANSTVGATITLGGSLSAVAVSPDGTRAFVTNTSGIVSTIDTATNMVVGSSISVGTYPTGLAFSPDGSRVYVVNRDDNTVSVIDTGRPDGFASAGNPNTQTGVVTGKVTVNNPTGQKLTYQVGTIGTGKVTITTGGIFTYTPNAAARHGAAQIGAGAEALTDTFTVTVSGGPNGTVSVPVTVAISPKNAAPTLGSPSAGKPNATTGAVTGTVAGKDADKDTLTYSATATSAKGGAVTVNPATGAFTYTPTASARHAAAAVGAPSAAKTDTFTVTLADGFGGTASKLVIVTVAPANEAPTVNATPSVNTPDTNGFVTGTVGAADADNDSLTYTAAPKKGTVEFGATGSFTYTPTAAARHAAAAPGAKAPVTTETFTVTVSDAYGGKVSKTVTVAIAPANQLPVTLNGTAGAPSTKTGAVTGKVTATDADKDALTYSAANTARGKVSVNDKTGAFTYTPTTAARHAAAANGATAADLTDSITVQVSDGHGGFTSKTVEVSILPANKVPTITAKVGKPNPTTGVVTGTIVGTDGDKDALKYDGPTTTPKGTVSIDGATGAFAYTPSTAARHAAAATGANTAAKQDSFTVTVTDGHGGTTTKTVAVSIAPTNNVPAVSATPTVGSPNPNTGIVTGTLGASDADGDTLTFKATPKKGTITISAGGEFTYTPTAAARAAATKANAPASAKQETFTVTVTDGFGGTTTKSVTVAIAPAGHVNGAPTNLVVDTGNPDSNTGIVTGTLRATDPDGDALTYSAPTTSTGGATVTVNATTGTFTYTPSPTQRHAAAASDTPVTDTFTVRANDGLGGTSTTAVNVVVSPANQAPTGGTVTGLTTNTTTGVVTGAVTGVTDNDGDTLTFSAPATSAGGGTVSIMSSGAFTYVPSWAQRHASAAIDAPGSAKTDAFDILVSDGHGSTTTTRVSVMVTPENTTPSGGSATDITTNTTTGVVAGTITGVTDNDGDSLTYRTPAASSGGAAVTITATTGAFTYTPTQTHRLNAQLSTTDNFIVTIDDGHGGTETVTVTVPVDPGIPIAGTHTVGTPESGTAVVTGAGAFTDTAGRTLTYSGPSTSAGGGSISIDPDSGVFVYRPSTIQRLNANAATTDTVTITASNGIRSTTETVTVQVTPTGVTATIPVGASPDGLVVNPDGSRVYVVVGMGTSNVNKVAVIDTVTNTVINTIQVGVNPQQLAISPDGSRVYVTAMGSASVPNSGNSVSVIDTSTNTVISTVNVPGGPVGVAVSPDGLHVYVSSRGSYQGGTVSVIETATNTVIDTIEVGNDPIAVTVSPDSSFVYAINYGSGTVSVIDSATRSVIQSIRVGTSPYQGAVSSDGSRLYVTNYHSGSVSVIDTSTTTVIKTIGAVAYPKDVAVSQDGDFAYVTYGLQDGGAVAVIDTSTNTVVARIKVATSAYGVAVSADGTHVYITMNREGSVQVFTV